MIFPKTKTTRGKVSNLNKIEGDSGDFRRRRCGVSVFAYDCVGISLSLHGGKGKFEIPFRICFETVFSSRVEVYFLWKF